MYCSLINLFNRLMFLILKYITHTLALHMNMGLPHKNQQRLTPVKETQVYLMNQHNGVMKGCGVPEGECWITSWISSPCASLLSSYARSGSLDDSAVLSWLAPTMHGLRAYPQLESPPETPSWLVAISWNDSLSSCFLHVWSQGHSSLVNAHCTHFPASIVMGGGANLEHSLMCLFIC